MNKVIIVAIAAMSIGLSGCATLFGPDSQTVNVRASNGQSFKGRLTDGTPISVPGPVQIKKSDSQPVQIFAEDNECSPVTTVNRQIEGTFWLNLVTGGLLGSATDYSTGKMWSYQTNVIVPCRS